jgi:prevent-host-death family protein
VESAGIAELKARLSEYLSRVKAGEEVLVTDRGKPVARLVPVGAGSETGPDDAVERARLRTMEREGLIRLGSGKLPEGFFEKERPADPGGLLREAALEEREEGR